MMRSIFCAHMVSMSTPPNITYNATALIKKVYDKLFTAKEVKDIVKIDDNGFIELKSDIPSSREKLDELISKLENVSNSVVIILKAKPSSTTLADPVTIESVKQAMAEDAKLTEYAAYVYVSNCLVHMIALLKANRFKVIYIETIKEAQEAGAAPFH